MNGCLCLIHLNMSLVVYRRVLIMDIPSYVDDLLSRINYWFSTNSEAYASELLENHEKCSTCRVTFLTGLNIQPHSSVLTVSKWLHCTKLIILISHYGHPHG